MTALPDAERNARLRLCRTKNIGPITFRRLLDHAGSARAAIDRLPELSGRGGKRLTPAPQAAIDKELAAITATGGHLVVLGDQDYPPPCEDTSAAGSPGPFQRNPSFLHLRAVIADS